MQWFDRSLRRISSFIGYTLALTTPLDDSWVKKDAAHAPFDLLGQKSAPERMKVHAVAGFETSLVGVDFREPVRVHERLEPCRAAPP